MVWFVKNDVKDIARHGGTWSINAWRKVVWRRDCTAGPGGRVCGFCQQFGYHPEESLQSRSGSF